MRPWREIEKTWDMLGQLLLGLEVSSVGMTEDIRDKTSVLQPKLTETDEVDPVYRMRITPVRCDVEIKVYCENNKLGIWKRVQCRILTLEMNTILPKSNPTEIIFLPIKTFLGQIPENQTEINLLDY